MLRCVCCGVRGALVLWARRVLRCGSRVLGLRVGRARAVAPGSALALATGALSGFLHSLWFGARWREAWATPRQDRRETDTRYCGRRLKTPHT